MEALKVMTYFKVSLSTCNWDSAFRMGFGGKITLSMQPADCNPLEVTVTTLGGEQTLSFDQ